MGIFGFGSVKKIEDFKVTDLKKERLTQEVKQDQLINRMKRSQEEYDSLLESASEPGLSDAEIDVSAYRMSQISKTRDKSEQDLQEAITRTSVIDSVLDVINQKKELQEKGIWKKINEIPEEELESQIENLAIGRKESKINTEKIAEMFDINRQTVQSKRSADFRRSKDEILSKRDQKSG